MVIDIHIELYSTSFCLYTMFYIVCRSWHLHPLLLVFMFSNMMLGIYLNFDAFHLNAVFST